MKIETNRLELVVLSAAQLRFLADDITALEKDLNCTYRGEPLRGRFLDFIRLQAKKTANDETNYFFHSFWLMIRKQDRVAIGMASFKNLPGEDREVEIGYGLGEEHRGNGFMTETVKAMCGWALEQETIDRVVAETNPGNIPSEHVLDRSGFVKYKTVGEDTWWKMEADALRVKYNKEPYYLAYEKRYQAVYSTGAERWGHSPEEPELLSTLTEWVERNNLKGKRIIEFACGEGASGVILSQLGCVYHGVDIAPSAVEKTRAAIAGFPTASVSLLDMVNEKVEGEFDAAIDVMGFHMLVTDDDRQKYLSNAHATLKSGAPMLFYKESYRQDSYEGLVSSYKEWLAISGSDYNTPQVRRVLDSDITVNVPFVPGRARTKDGYINEFVRAGFIVDDFKEMEINEQNPYSATIWVHKQ